VNLVNWNTACFGCIAFLARFPKEIRGLDLQNCWSTTDAKEHQYVYVFLTKSVHSTIEYLSTFFVLYQTATHNIPDPAEKQLFRLYSGLEGV